MVRTIKYAADVKIGRTLEERKKGWEKTETLRAEMGKGSAERGAWSGESEHRGQRSEIRGSATKIVALQFKS